MKRSGRLTVSSHALALLCVLYLGLAWGTTYLAIKVALRSMPVFMISCFRELAAGLILLAIAFIFEKPQQYSLGTIVRQGIYGFGFFTAARGMMTLSLDFAQSGPVALVFSLIPVYVLAINLLTGRFLINRLIIVGMALGAVGMFLVFRESLRDAFGAGQLIGMGLAFIGALSWAGTSVLLSEKKELMSPVFRSAVQLLFGAAGLWGISLVRGETVTFGEVETGAVLAIMYLAVFGSVIGFMAFVYAIRHLPVARATLYAYLNPFVALFLGWMFLGERMSLELLLSFSVTLAGVYLVNLGYRKVLTADG